MGYIVRIAIGKGMNRTVTQSIILPNKERVRAYIKRNPVGNINTRITIKDINTNKIYSMVKGRGYYWGKKY